MNLLNLDEVVGVKRSVVLFGSEYSIKDQTLGDMILAMKDADSTDDSEAAVIESLLKQAHSILPDCPKDVLGKMNLRQLKALTDFIRQSDEEIVSADGKKKKK